MTHKVLYGKRPAEVVSAAGVSGVLCRSAVDGSCFFRVYAKDHTFADYALRPDCLAVTISEDELASFYKIGEHRILDHSPSVLGLESVSSSKKHVGAQQGASADAHRSRR